MHGGSTEWQQSFAEEPFEAAVICALEKFGERLRILSVSDLRITETKHCIFRLSVSCASRPKGFDVKTVTFECFAVLPRA